MKWITKLFLCAILTLLAIPALTPPTARAEEPAPAADTALLPTTVLIIKSHAQAGLLRKENLDQQLPSQLDEVIRAALIDRCQFIETYTTEYLLKKYGIINPAEVAQSALADALRETGARYIIVADLQPFRHKNHQALFKFSVETTGTLHLCVIDTSSRAMLFETQIQETAEKEDPISYNEVIPLAMDKIIAQLKTQLSGDIFGK